VSELGITLVNAGFWLSLGQALLVASIGLLVGIWVARLVGLLAHDALLAETLGVGLASGLMVIASVFAAVWSGGRSSFTPVAVGFALAVGLALLRRLRRRTGPEASAAVAAASEPTPRGAGLPRRWRTVAALLACGAFIAVVAAFYGATMTPSPRDGVQPVQGTDVAFYAVLSADLTRTGTETTVGPSGFDELPGAPPQDWYHWGELWLTAAVIAILGAAPLDARYFVVLPVVLLAAAALTGTVVRRLNGSRSPLAFLFGFLACLFLAPIPLFAGSFFGTWAVGQLVLVAVFGLASVAVLLALYCLAVLPALQPSWPLSCFVGSAIAFILPAHVVIALLALVGVGGVWTLRIAVALGRDRRLPPVPPAWRRPLAATGIAVLATVVWGVLTGHGLGGGAPLAGVAPFNASWRDTVVSVTAGAWILFAIPVAWLDARRDRPVLAEICLGTMILLAVGAAVWGWRLSSFNAFYLFLGAIVVFAVPVSAAAAWRVLQRLRTARHRTWAVAAVLVWAVQMELGVVLAIGRADGSGSTGYPPIPVSLLEEIRGLPAGAKLAYSCQRFEEISFVNSKLVGIEALTGRRVVPMCFQADVNGPLLGAPVSDQTPDAGFLSAPQRALYPDAAARPSSGAVRAFLREHGIDYIYADAAHPNALVDDAVPIATSGESQVLRIP
jgi:hypothetical protein